MPVLGRTLLKAVFVVLVFAGTSFAHDGGGREHHKKHRAKTLYIWAGDQARVAPDFLAVIDFDREFS